MTFRVNCLGMRRVGWIALALSVAATVAQAELTLRPEPSSPFDLKISAGLKGQSSDAPRYVTWEDINTLPTEVLELEGEFVAGLQAVKVVFLDELWSALPVTEGADMMLAYCADNYFSIYRDEFITKWRPFLVLAIDGNGPDKWPPPGLSFNPGPYVISVADEVVAGADSLLDVGHKKPWGVNEIRFETESEVLAPAFAMKRQQLSASGEHGRELWINSCSSCHIGPGDWSEVTKANDRLSSLKRMPATMKTTFVVTCGSRRRSYPVPKWKLTRITPMPS